MTGSGDERPAGETTGTEARPKQHLAVPEQSFDLAAESAALLSEARSTNGRAAKTLVKVPHLHIVLSAATAGVPIDEHAAEAPISIHVIVGSVRVASAERTVDLPAGGLLILDRGIRHTHEGLEDSVILITVSWPDAQAASPRERPQ